MRELADALAGHGQRVLIWDRPNTGDSDVCFNGASESEMQADELAGLLRALDLAPAVIVGGSGGIRGVAAHRGPPSRRRLQARHVVDLGWHVRAAHAGHGLLRRVVPGRVARRHGSGRRAAGVGRGARAQPVQPGTVPRLSTRRSSSRRWTGGCSCTAPIRTRRCPASPTRRARPRPADTHLPQRRERSVPHARNVGAVARADPRTRLVEPPWGDTNGSSAATPPAPAPAACSNTGPGSPLNCSTSPLTSRTGVSRWS